MLLYNQALSDYQNALGLFLVALGLDGGKPVVLTGKPEISKLSLDMDTLIADKLLQRPDLVAQRNEIQRLKTARTESFLSTKGPQLILSGTWEAPPNKEFIGAGAYVRIPVDPWIPRSKGDQMVKQSNAEYQKALLDLQDMENNARQEIRSYTDRIRNTWTEVEIARLQASYARRAFELAEQAYRRGTMRFLDYETTRNALIDTQQQQLQSELNYKILVLDLASALNMKEEELINYSR
jgi:outer membrane protein TolC